MSITLLERTSVRAILPWAVLGLGLGLVVVNLALLFKGGTIQPSIGETPATAPASGPLPGTVTLAEGKLKEAGIDYAKAELVTLPVELGVPGRIDANQDRQVQVRPRASGVIRDVKASLGQNVKKGQTLVVLDSADVGTARLNLRAKQRELATVRYEAAWKKQIAANVAALIPELRKRTEAPVIEKMFADRPLGSFRATLLPAYSKYDIAYHEQEKTLGLYRERIYGEHPMVIATHTREGSQAEFEGVVEQARYEANQQSRVADQQVKLAESDVIDAAQRLRILGVSENVEALLAQADKTSIGKLSDEDVTAYTIAAPFDGTIITKSILTVPSQKVDMNDVLLGLADLSTVWVTANIPESDFALLPALQQGKIRLNATAYPGRTLDAKLLSVGATVDATTRTVPMLAETPNADGLLKIGMFVRIVLDTAVESRALSVPASALVEIEGKKGVFLPDGKDGRTFAFRAVKLGRESGNRQVIVSGLTVGETVVSKGAFILKSELILQNESEEE
jgi:membrane fusion protein, heavy metal efflux system